MKWQRVARTLIAVAAVAFGGYVAWNMERRTAPQSAPPVPQTDPKAVVESQGGHTLRLSGADEDGTLQYERLLTYANGASKMIGVTITSRRNGRTYVVHGGEGQAGESESTVELFGGVRLESSDGMVVTAERASFAKAKNLVRLPGAASFSKDRMTGSGFGIDYDQVGDVLTIGDRASIEVRSDEHGAGAMTLTSGALAFRRTEHVVHLDRNAKITYGRQIVDADQAVAYLSADEQRLELLELRNNSRISATAEGPGDLESLSGRNVDLRYGGEGSNPLLQRAAVDGSAVLQLAGEKRQPGRQISANALSVGFGADGSTPVDLTARHNVRVTMPGESTIPSRTIQAQALDSTGHQQQGLTGARFRGECSSRSVAKASTARYGRRLSTSR